MEQFNISVLQAKDSNNMLKLHPKYVHNGIKRTQTDPYAHVHCSIIHSSQKVEPTPSVHQQMSK